MPAGRPRQFDRTEALKGAMDVFWDHGYVGASMADLVEGMGIGRQSLYDTFGDKRGLYLQALDHYMSTTMRCVIDRLAEPGSGLENVRAVLKMWEQHNASPKCRGCMLSKSVADLPRDDPEVARILRRHVGRLEKAFKDALDRAQSAGDISAKTSTRALAWTLTNTGQGLSLLGNLGVGKMTVNDIIKTTERLLV